MPVLNPVDPRKAAHDRALTPEDSILNPETDQPSPPAGFLSWVSTLARQLAGPLKILGGNRVTLVLTLLALNAWTLPFAECQQDDRLYAFQVLNVLEDGRYNGDIFFAYGSQDRYTIFSHVAAPLARLLGIPFCFFLLYLASRVLYFVALARLLDALAIPRAVAALGLIALAVSLVPFGGLDIFFVGENIMTPRLPATALVLLGLERMLRERLLSAFLILVGALVLHPLMAFGGLLIFLGWCVLRFFSLVQAAALGGAVALTGLAILAVSPWGGRLLGTMDADWFDAVRRVNPYQVPAMWRGTDWLHIAVGFATILAAWSTSTAPATRRFLALLAGAAGLGLAGTVVACWLPYALPVQAQPYRVLWLLQFLQIPLGIALLISWWNHESVVKRAGSVALLTYFVLLQPELLSLLPLTVAVGILAVSSWSARREHAERDMLKQALIGLGLGLALWLTCQTVLIGRYWDQLAGIMDPFDHARYWSAQLNPVCRVLLCAVVLLVLIRVIGMGVLFRGLALAAFLLIQLTSFGLSNLTGAAEYTRPRDADVRFVREFLKTRADNRADPATVYWPLGRVECIWQGLHANSYLCFTQLSGNSFHRATAMEGQRRMELAQRFEIDFFRRHALLLSAKDRRTIEEAYQTTLEEPAPTLADLEQLCRDPKLDFLVLRQAFDGLPSASNGTWFIYDRVEVCTALDKARGIGYTSHAEHLEEE